MWQLAHSMIVTLAVYVFMFVIVLSAQLELSEHALAGGLEGAGRVPPFGADDAPLADLQRRLVGDELVEPLRYPLEQVGDADHGGRGLVVDDQAVVERVEEI